LDFIIKTTTTTTTTETLRNAGAETVTKIFKTWIFSSKIKYKIGKTCIT
jgi:hypothetical protein